MEKDKVILEDLLNGYVEDLPEFIQRKNIIYCCENIVNGKVYIGETKLSLRNRWQNHKRQLNKERATNLALYNAIRKYGTLNFNVYILEENLDNDIQRKEREKYWISKYNAFIDAENSNGYNMTTGGKVESKISKNSISKRQNTIIKKYGKSPFLTKESREKALKANKANHGGILAFQKDIYRKKARETQLKKYGMLAMHLPENKEKSKLAQEKLKEENGGVLPFNTPEAIKKAQKSAPLHRMIGCINRHIIILNNKNLELNAKNYVLNTDDAKHMWQQHIPNVLRKIDELRKLDKWSQDMENIFSSIIYDETEKGIKKIKFKDNI